MTTTRTAKRPMDPTRKAALIAGLFYIGTFVFSIPALGLYDGVLNNRNFVLGAGTTLASASVSGGVRKPLIVM